MSFSANCRIRGSPADVIRPFDEELSIFCGWLKLTLLNRLKNSDRNCAENRSVILKFLSRLASVLKRRGPLKIFFPESPKVPIGLGTNAPTLKY